MSLKTIKIVDYSDKDGDFIVVKDGDKWIKCFTYKTGSLTRPKFGAIRSALNYISTLSVKPKEKTLGEYEIN